MARQRRKRRARLPALRTPVTAEDNVYDRGESGWPIAPNATPESSCLPYERKTRKHERSSKKLWQKSQEQNAGMGAKRAIAKPPDSLRATMRAAAYRLDVNHIDQMRDNARFRLRVSGLRTLKPGQRLKVVKDRPQSTDLELREARITKEILRSGPFAQSETGDLNDSSAKSQNQQSHEGDFAATKLQCWWRVILAVYCVRERKAAREAMMFSCASRIQAMQRRAEARARVARMRKEKRRHEASLTISRVYRGHQGRLRARARQEEVDRNALEHASAVIAQSCARGFLVRQRLKLQAQAITAIASAWRALLARRCAAQRRDAAQRLGEFGRTIVCRQRYMDQKKRALQIQCFRRQIIAQRRAAARRQELQQEALERARCRSANDIQRLFRGMRGRQYFAKERCAQDRLEAALQTQEGVQLIVSHLVHQENVDRPRFLKDKYREAIMRSPESSELRYGRALHSAVLEMDELAAQKFVLEGKRLDHDDDGFLMMERIFAMATRVGGQTRTRAHLHRALLNIWCHPAREQMAIELLERVAGTLCDPAAAKLAEWMLARFEKEIQAKSFHLRCGSQDAVAFTRKDFEGELLAWRRGHNYLFRVRYAVTTNEHQTRMVAELVVTTRETREVVSQLDRRDLLQAGCEDELAHKLTEMLDVIRTADGVARIFLKFTQEPFPMMTALIPSTGSHLNVIAFPAKPDAEHVLDVILHASDLALGEDYRLEISNDEMKALFADEEGLLLARTRPGWRRKCKPLIAKLVSLLDLADLAVPTVGDLVVSIEPRYLRYMNASLQAQASTKRPRWYRLGRVVERSGLQFRMTPLREKKPQGSLLFEDLAKSKPTLQASSANGAKAQDSTYWLGLEDARLARVREGKLPSTLELVGPRVRINEPPDLARSFRLEKQRRKLILCGEARKTEAASNVAAIQVQRVFRGMQGRRKADRALEDFAASQIAEAWRLRVVLMRKVREHALAYRHQEAATRICTCARGYLARLRFEERRRACFGDTSLRTAMRHLAYQRSGGTLDAVDRCLAMLTFDLAESYTTQTLEMVSLHFADALKVEPNHPDVVAGSAILAPQRTWMEKRTLEDALSVVQDEGACRLDQAGIEAFRLTYQLYLQRITRLWCNNAVSVLQVALAERLVFHNAEEAFAAALHAKRLVQLGTKRGVARVAEELEIAAQREAQIAGEKDEATAVEEPEAESESGTGTAASAADKTADKSSETLTKAAHRDTVSLAVTLNFAVCCLFRLKTRWAMRRILHWWSRTRSKNPRLNATFCKTWRLQNEKPRAWLRYAWRLHAFDEGSADEIELAYAQAMNDAKRQNNSDAIFTVACSQDLFQLAQGRNPSSSALAKDPMRFWQSPLNGLRRMLEFGTLQKPCTKGILLLHAALMQWHAGQNAAESLRLLTQAMTLDPTSVELNIGCSGLRRAMAHPIEIEKRSPLVPPPAESTSEAHDDEEDEPLHGSKVTEREPSAL